MSGPDHYTAAEELTDAASAASVRGERDRCAALQNEALTHAVLALVAATIEPAGWQPGEHPDWREVLR